MYLNKLICFMQFLLCLDDTLKKKSSTQTIPCLNNISMWSQNLEGYFKNAIETKSVNDWMISVAPSISYEYV